MDSLPLFGRNREEALLRGLLFEPSCRVVTITGIGGMGKTSMALKLSREMEPLFPGGSFFVPLTELEHSAQVVPRILMALGAAPLPGEPLKQLADRLAARGILLVLDNFEHVIAAAPHIEYAAARMNDSRILITSRTELEIPGERVYKLSGIGLPGDDRSEDAPSVRMFLSILRPQVPVPEEGLELICRICRAVEGIPLGLKLAASLASEKPLSQVLEKVSGPGVIQLCGEAEERRHRSLRSVFSLSWNLLTAEERRAFASLSVFRGAFPPHAARLVTGTDAAVLESLCRKSLLEKPSSGTYELHPLMRSFSLSMRQSVNVDTERLDRLHSAHFCGLLARRGKELSGPAGGEVLKLFVDCISDLTAGLSHAVELEMTDCLRRALPSMLDILVRRGISAVGLDLFRNALELFQRLNHPDAEMVRSCLGSLYAEVALYDQAVPCFERASWSEDPAVSTRSVHSLGRVYMRTGNLERSEQYYTRALERAREYGLKKLELTVLSGLGDLYNHLYRVDRARYFLERAVELAESLSDRAGLYSTLVTLSNLMYNNRMGEEALEYSERALKAAEELGGEACEAVAMITRADALNLLGRSSEALPLARKAVETFTGSGMNWGIQTSCSTLAGILMNLGMEEEGIETARRLVSVSREIGGTYNTMEYLLTAGAVFERAGLKDEALDAYRWADKIAENLKVERHLREIEERIAGLLE